MIQKIKRFLFSNQSARQTIAKNTFWLAVSNFGGRFLRAFIIIYAARVLGAGQWGIYSYAITVVTFFTAFLDVGINPILVREMSKQSDEKEKGVILSTTFFIRIALLIIGVLIVLLVVPTFTRIEEAKALLSIVVFIFVFDTMREFGFSIFRAAERMEREAGCNIFTNIAIVVAGFVFLSFATTSRSFAYAYAVGTGIGMFITLLAVRSYLKNLWSNFMWSKVAPILRSAWPFAISGLLGILLLNTDIFIIGFFKSAEDIGYYSAANRIIQLLYLIPSIIAISALPMFSRFTENKAKLRGILERLITTNYAIAIPAAVGGAILGTEIIMQIFGSSYAPGGLPFKILAVTLLADFPAVILGHIIFAYDRQTILIRNGLIAGITNVVLDLLLIPKYGIVGSAVATLFVQIVSNIYLWHKVKQIVQFTALPHLPRIAVAAIVMGIVCVGLQMAGVNVFVIVGIGIAVYALTLYVSRDPILTEFKSTLQPAVSNEQAGNELAAAMIQEETHRRTGSG